MHINISKSEFESYCSQHGTFMQSALWGKVKTGWKSELLVARNEHNRVCGTMLVLVKRLPFGLSLMYSPRGPVCNWKNYSVLSDLINQALSLASKYNAFMLKIDPMIKSYDMKTIEYLKELGFVHHNSRIGYENIQCRENYILDLSGKGEEDVFSSFKSKWRYNIRLASRKGVKCDFYREEKLDDFVKLMEQTAKRDGFQCRKRSYFERLLKVFGERATLCMCYRGEEPLSGALCIEYAGITSYVYGCSSSQYRNCMPNYLMQWKIIQKAIRNNCHTYDFCGVPYWNDISHPNYGVYRFKQGFNGKVITYAGEFDYCFKPLICKVFDYFR